MDQTLKLCVHGKQSTEITKQYFQQYQNLPKALIRFDCKFCQFDFLHVNYIKNGEQVKIVDKIIDSQLNMQLNQEMEYVIDVLYSLILQHTNKLDDYLITRVLFLIKILNTKYENSQELILFEKLFILVLKLQEQKQFLQKNEIKSFVLNGIYNTTEIHQNYFQKKPKAATISREFIVYEYRKQYLFIYHIEKKKHVRILKLVYGLSIFVFSINQSYLFVGSNQGIFYRIDANSGFKKIEKFKFSFSGLINLEISILNYNTIYVVLNGEYHSKLIQLSFKERKIISIMKFLASDYSFDAKNGFFHYIPRVVSDFIFNNIFDIQQHPEKDLYDFVVIHSFRMQNRTLIQWDPLRIINVAKIKFLSGNKLLLSDKRRRLKFRIMTLNFKSFMSPKFKSIPFNYVGDFSSNIDGLISIQSTKDNNTWCVLDSDNNCQELYRTTGTNPLLNKSNKLKLDNMMIINDPSVSLFLCIK